MATASPWLIACSLWLAAVAAMDLRMRRVRNWMVLLGLAMGAAALASGAQPLQVTAWSALGGMLAGFAVLLPFYARRWMGAGDVKFAAAAGLWFGLGWDLLLVWTGGSLLAGLHALVVVLLRDSPTGLWLQARLPVAWVPHLPASGAGSGRQAAPGGTQPPQRSIPYAGYLAIAAIAVAWHRSHPPV